MKLKKNYFKLNPIKKIVNTVKHNGLNSVLNYNKDESLKTNKNLTIKLDKYVKLIYF